MKILYIYRHPDMGFSIGKVFKTIENEMRKYAEVDSVYMPCANYKPLGLYRNIKAARQAVKKKHYDIVHITGAEHYLLPFLKDQNTIVTVHDLGSVLNCRGIRRLLKKLFFVDTLQFASAVTFISHSCMTESLELVALEDSKCFVVYDAVDPSFVFDERKNKQDKPVILHIGTKKNKNLERVIRALKGISCKLRIIGDLQRQDIELLQGCEIDYSNAQNLTDAEIMKEYIDCDIVSFPSTYEGFGMPIIEGQSIGRPVLTSSIPPMNEVARDTAVLVDPYSVDSIREGFVYIMSHGDEYVSRGIKNVERFSVSVIAQKYISIYKKLWNK